MIGYPSPDWLLERFGSHDVGRREARAEIERVILERAKQEAQTAGRSLRCQEGDHRHLHDGYWMGCRNDGTNCICECHDAIQPAEIPATEAGQ